MPLTVLSPYSGRPVKVRDQDVGRAVRDEEGRVFYVVPRQHGEGFYASLTRQGSMKDEQRYAELEEKGAVLEEHRTETAPARPDVHDATGRKRSALPRLLAWLLVLVVLMSGAWLGWGLLSERGVVGSPPPYWEKLDEWWPEKSPDALPDELPSPTEPGTPPTVDPVSSPAEGAGDEARHLQSDGSSGRPPTRPFDATTPPSDTPLTAPPTDVAWDPRVPAPESDAGNTPVRVPTPAGGTSTRPVPFDPYFDFTTTVSGLRYRVERPSFGPRAQVRDFVVVRYTVRHAATGLELDATPPDEPHGFVLWSGAVFRGLDEGVAGMRVGERRTLVVPAHLAGLPEGAPAAEEGEVPLPATTLHVDAELVNVLPGVRKQVIEPGTGRFAAPGDTIRLHWTLWAGQGDPPVIDSRRFGGPVTLVLGTGEVIQGLELGLTGMAEGEVAELHIPPYLAYGAQGAAGGLVPPHASVRCRVEMLEVKHER